MTSVKPRQYWETSCFIALLQNEPSRGETGQRIFNDALNGQLRIVTSTLAIAECSGGQTIARLPQERLDALNQSIAEMFFQRCVTLIEPDPLLAQHAQRIQQWSIRARSQKIRPIDAIHVASAIRGRCTVVFSYDSEHILRLNGTQPPEAPAPLRIEEPTWTGTLPLFSAADEQPPN